LEGKCSQFGLPPWCARCSSCGSSASCDGGIFSAGIFPGVVVVIVIVMLVNDDVIISGSGSHFCTLFNFVETIVRFVKQLFSYLHFRGLLSQVSVSFAVLVSEGHFLCVVIFNVVCFDLFASIYAERHFLCVILERRLL
jgi:hypothetical protein